MHQSFSDFTYLMPGYMGRKFNVQGAVEPNVAGEAYLEMIVTFLRKCFNNELSYDYVKEVASRYPFIIEGTNIELDDVDVEKDMLKAEEQLKDSTTSSSSESDKQYDKIESETHHHNGKANL